MQELDKESIWRQHHPPPQPERPTVHRVRAGVHRRGNQGRGDSWELSWTSDQDAESGWHLNPP